MQMSRVYIPKVPTSGAEIQKIHKSGAEIQKIHQRSGAEIQKIHKGGAEIQKIHKSGAENLEIHKIHKICAEIRRFTEVVQRTWRFTKFYKIGAENQEIHRIGAEIQEIHRSGAYELKIHKIDECIRKNHGSPSLVSVCGRMTELKSLRTINSCSSHRFGNNLDPSGVGDSSDFPVYLPDVDATVLVLCDSHTVLCSVSTLRFLSVLRHTTRLVLEALQTNLGRHLRAGMLCVRQSQS